MKYNEIDCNGLHSNWGHLLLIYTSQEPLDTQKGFRNSLKPQCCCYLPNAYNDTRVLNALTK